VEEPTVSQSIPAGLTREHVLKALAELDAGVEHPFGTPTKFEVVHGGKRYAPKAVIGLACRHLLGQIRQPDEFSGGEAPGQANFVLRKLGFTVVGKGQPVDDEQEQEPGREWSGEEVQLIVGDYFEMLEQELLGKSYNKTDHRRELAPRLTGRSDGSIEFKHANISAVLTGMGLPYIDGYKPRGNYQALLRDEIEAFLQGRPGFLDRLADAPILNPDQGPAAEQPDLETVFEDAPKHAAVREPGKPWLSRRGQRIDFAQRDAQNRRLAALGEEFVVRLERHRLRDRGRDDLADKVVWASKEWGDGLGYDVRSFETADDSELLVEVKTTGQGKFAPFYVTATELRCSEDVGERFLLYRVFDFTRAARLYVLSGALSSRCTLEPIQYRATAFYAS
jgi:hypothetical protein